MTLISRLSPFLLSTALALFPSAAILTAQAPAPDLILLHGKMFTSSSAHPYVEALGILGDRIVATGTSQQVAAIAGPHTHRIDLGGRVVVPGFNDAHFHPGLDVAAQLLNLQTQEPSWSDVTREIQRAVASTPPGTFIFGSAGAVVYETAEANRSTLDKLAPDHPVFLSGWTGHYLILNTAAMRKVGIGEDEPDPLGGRYLHGSDGRLNGIILEYAKTKVVHALQAMVTDADAVEQFHRLFSEAAQFGITSIQNMSNPIPADRLASLFVKAQTPIRLRIIRFPSTDEHRRLTEEGRDLPRSPSPLVTVSGTKYILDGTPIERSAAMRQPYADAPNTSGWMNFSEKDMEAMLRESLSRNDPLLVHIVGDRTTETFLNAMDATGGNAVWSQRRVRVEHGDGIMPDLMPRVRDLGIVVVQNPTHLALPDLMRRRFSAAVIAHDQPLRSLIDAGIPVALGSDGPMNPFLNIMLASNVPAHPNQSITREQAVTAYTLTAAYAEFAEKDKGSLETGKLADLAVLSQDIFTIPSEDLPKTTSILTIVGGKVIYDAGTLEVH